VVRVLGGADRRRRLVDEQAEAAVKGWTPSWLPLVSERELLDRMGAAAHLMDRLEDRIMNLEAALKDAGVPIPDAATPYRAERRRQTERFMRELGL
jgi:hypothetical protein